MNHSCNNFRSNILGCTCLVTSTMLSTSICMPWKYNIFISKQKHSFSQLLLFAINKLLSETQFCLSNLICTGKDGLGRITFFLLKMWVGYVPITIYLENLSTSTQKSNRIIVTRTMAQNTWRGWCKK